MNRIKAQKLMDTAQRSIKIIKLILEGKDTVEIVDELVGFKPRVDRQLVDYYIRQLK